MSEQDRLDDALDAAIDQLRRGRPLDAVAGQRDLVGARDLLETADALRAVPPVPAPARLADNYAIVRAAVERAQMSAGAEATPTPKQSWWNRRLTFASLSLPAGVAALLLVAGTSGAAASIMTTEAGHSIANLVRPSWVDDVVPGGHNEDTPGQTTNQDNPTAPGGDAPGAANRPTHVELSGTVGDVNGNTFTLTNGDGEWKVNIDANTNVQGDILEGATADVGGEVTAEKNLHATSVSATGGEPAATPGKPEDPGKRPDGAGKPEDPGPTAEPGGRGQHAPPGQSGQQESGGTDDENDGGSRKP